MFFLEHANLPYPDYRRKTVEAQKEKGVNAVTSTDSSSLQSYLNGQVDTCSQIDLSAVQSFVPLPSEATASNNKPASKSKPKEEKKKHEGYF